MLNCYEFVARHVLKVIETAKAHCSAWYAKTWQWRLFSVTNINGKRGFLIKYHGKEVRFFSSFALTGLDNAVQIFYYKGV
jgi:hypothetical protein